MVLQESLEAFLARFCSRDEPQTPLGESPLDAFNPQAATKLLAGSWRVPTPIIPETEVLTIEAPQLGSCDVWKVVINLQEKTVTVSPHLADWRGNRPVLKGVGFFVVNTTDPNQPSLAFTGGNGTCRLHPDRICLQVNQVNQKPVERIIPLKKQL